MARTFLSCCIPLISWFSGFLWHTSPLSNIPSGEQQTYPIFHVALASPDSRVHNATRSTAYECLLYESAPQGGGLPGYIVRRSIAPEWTDPGRYLNGFKDNLKVYGRKKRAQDSATGCVALCAGSWQYIECEHENHWICVYVACKNTTQMMSNLSRLLEDSHSHAPMTTIILFILSFFFVFVCYSPVLLIIWVCLFFLFFAIFRKPCLFCRFCFLGNFAVLVKPCLFFFQHFLSFSYFCETLWLWQLNPNIKQQTVSALLVSGPETRLQDLSIGQLERNRGTDRICPCDMRTGLWRRPPTLHDGEASWPCKGCTQNTTEYQYNQIPSDPIRSQSSNLLRMKGGQGGVRNRKDIVLPAEWLIFFFVMMIHDGNPY